MPPPPRARAPRELKRRLAELPPRSRRRRRDRGGDGGVCRHARPPGQLPAGCTGCSKRSPTASPIWRVATEEINYRRFFNINDLAGLRIELPELFEATHRLVFALVERGEVQGLRIDHIDGLFDPAAYCAALRERVGEETYRRRREDPGALRAAAGLADRRHHRLRFRQPGPGAVCRPGRPRRR